MKRVNYLFFIKTPLQKIVVVSSQYVILAQEGGCWYRKAFSFVWPDLPNSSCYRKVSQFVFLFEVMPDLYHTH